MTKHLNLSDPKLLSGSFSSAPKPLAGQGELVWSSDDFYHLEFSPTRSVSFYFFSPSAQQHIRYNNRGASILLRKGEKAHALDIGLTRKGQCLCLHFHIIRKIGLLAVTDVRKIYVAVGEDLHSLVNHPNPFYLKIGG